MIKRKICFIGWILLLCLLACRGEATDSVRIEPVEVEKCFSEDPGLFISFLHLASADSERIVLYNTQGLYLMKKEADTFALQTTVSFQQIGIEIEGPEAARFVFDESGVQIIPGYPEEKPKDGMEVYRYRYGEKRLTKYFSDWNEIESLSGWEKKPKNFDRENLAEQLRKQNTAYALYGENYIQFAQDEKIAFLLLNQEQEDTDQYVCYGEFDPEKQLLQIYPLKWTT